MDDRIAEIRETIWWCEEHGVGVRNKHDHATPGVDMVERILVDSDALIIRRDKNGEWPEWALRATLTRPREWQVEVLDALALASSQGVEP